MTVLAIGLDAAEGSLIRRLAAEGELPRIAELIRDGAWSPIRADQAGGSGGIWPTFVSDRLPAEHGIYGEWVWDPTQMAVGRPPLGELTAVGDRWPGPLGLFGVPVARPSQPSDGFEVADWGVHDRWASPTAIRQPRVTPAHLRASSARSAPDRRRRIPAATLAGGLGRPRPAGPRLPGGRPASRRGRRFASWLRHLLRFRSSCSPRYTIACTCSGTQSSRSTRCMPGSLHDELGSGPGLLEVTS